MSGKTTVRSHNFQDLAGQRYGLLTAESFAGHNPKGRSQWTCRCDCGNVKVLVAGDLKSGHVKSCGCSTKTLLSEVLKTRASERAANINAARIDRENGIVLLNNGMIALVDVADVELIEGRVWQAQSSHKNWYARASGKPGKAVMMHVLIMGKKEGFRIDHRNGNGLDNRRENLRWATRSQNATNISQPARGLSQFRGVSGGWMATVACNGHRQRFGPFLTQEEAARVYDRVASAVHGEFATLNFPEEVCNG